MLRILNGGLGFRVKAGFRGTYLRFKEAAS